LGIEDKGEAGNSSPIPPLTMGVIKYLGFNRRRSSKPEQTRRRQAGRRGMSVKDVKTKLHNLTAAGLTTLVKKSKIE
jgi:hypothetical protein